MNNYINIDKIGMLSILIAYFSIMASIPSLSSIFNNTLLIVSYNVVFLFILYKFKFSKHINALQIILMIFATSIIIKELYGDGLISVLLFIAYNYLLFSLIKFSFQLRKLFKYNYLYINKKTFRPRPVLFFILVVLYIICIGVVLYTSSFKSIINQYKLPPVLYFINTLCNIGMIYIFYRLIYKYKSAYRVLSLSSNRKIYVSSLVNPRSVDTYEWFKTQVEPYVYYAHYNKENGIITFDDEDDIIKLNEDNETVEYSLDKSIDVMNTLISDENSFELSSLLSSIIDKLKTINNLHKEKYQFNKYVFHINERYIPYVKSLVQAYYNNMQLGAELTKNMQEKIISSLKKIDDTFEKSIQEMYNRNVLELESYMEAMDIILSYKSSGS